MSLPVEAMVVDASVAAKWTLTDEEYVDQAGALLVHLDQGHIELAAPHLIRCEVASSIIVATQHQPPRLTPERAEDAIAKFLDLDIETFDESDLLLPAYALVRRYGCAVYDAIYLALAQRLGLPFLTADRRFYDKVHQSFDVIWIAQYPLQQA